MRTNSNLYRSSVIEVTAMEENEHRPNTGGLSFRRCCPIALQTPQNLWRARTQQFPARNLHLVRVFLPTVLQDTVASVYCALRGFDVTFHEVFMR